MDLIANIVDKIHSIKYKRSIPGVHLFTLIETHIVWKEEMDTIRWYYTY